MYGLFNLLLKQGDTTPRYINVQSLLTVYDFTSSDVIPRVQIRKNEIKNDLIASIDCTFQAPDKLIFVPPQDLKFTHLPSEIPQSLLKRKNNSFNKFEKLEYNSIPGKPYVWEFQIKSGDIVKTFITGGLVVIKDFNYVS